MTRQRSKITRWRSEESGVAAIEFALALPFLLLVMLFGFQLIVYVNATQKVALVAQSISQMISRAAPPGNSTTATVDSLDIHFSYDTALVLFPYMLHSAKRQGIPWWQNITINYASISFTPISSTCSDPTDQSACYVANVVWTSTGFWPGGYRPCGIPLLPSNNEDPPSIAKLPRSVYGPASLIVIDVSFDFKPSFGANFFPSLRIARSAYLQPRYANLIKFDTTGDTGVITRCPGY